ncbi:MAG TPA: hypothetical protein P5023_06870 [Bacteroidales bacterium]|nr:hypothetical protein [Bacteroidales bacterium]
MYYIYTKKSSKKLATNYDRTKQWGLRMKAGGRYNIDNRTENVISGFEYAASSLSYLHEDITSGNGSLAAILPIIAESLGNIYKCDFDILHLTSPVSSLSEFFQSYLSRSTMATQSVRSPNFRGRTYLPNGAFNKDRARLLKEAPRGGRRSYAYFGMDDDMDTQNIPGRDKSGKAIDSPFTLEFSQNGGFTYEEATPNDFILQAVFKQKSDSNYGQFLLDTLIKSGHSYFSDLESVSDMKRLMNADPNNFNKNLNAALQDSLIEQFTDLYIEAVQASGNDSARPLNINVDWKQDRTTVTCDIGIYIQDFRL